MSAALDCSLRVRLMLAAATLAVLFMLGLLPAMQGAFSLALQDSIEQRLASDVTTLISAARVENNRLLMPAQLPDERFNLTDSRLLGYIYDREGHLVWRSRAQRKSRSTTSRVTTGAATSLQGFARPTARNSLCMTSRSSCSVARARRSASLPYWPVREYRLTLEGLRENLYLGFGAACWCC
jgi:two-component system sensor histidine kinase PhoQ